MPNHKRTIPVSEVKPGDSFRVQAGFRSGQTWRVVNAHAARGGGVTLTAVNDMAQGHFIADFATDATMPVTVGHTNRKAKRARGKMARRERKKAPPIRSRHCAFTHVDEVGSWGIATFDTTTGMTRVVAEID